MALLEPSAEYESNEEILDEGGLPEEYRRMEHPELMKRIAAAKESLGEKLVILGHHYQRDEIIQFADFQGDSLKLAQQALTRKDAKYIVFCGVHFMAESADILTSDEQVVILPNMKAGCSMADMAAIGQVERCWEELSRAGVAGEIVPVTYINSAADLKAFVGRHGGIVCTSSNAPKIIEWALNQKPRLLFFPDQHLGRVSALKQGIPLEEMLLWDPQAPLGGHDEKALRAAKVYLWKGYCSIHQRFTVEQIEQARKKHPGVRVVVHPESSLEVVQAADEYGSTEYIRRVIQDSPAGSVWAVGTEVTLVHRLAEEHPDKTVFCLDPVVWPCETMYRIHPAFLCWVLESLVEGKVINQVKVPEEMARWARVALDRMLEIS